MLVAASLRLRQAAKSKAFVRCFSAGQGFSIYEYPTRKEAPEISATTAEKALESPPPRSPSPKRYQQSDPFDDSCSLSDDEIYKLKEKQQQELSSISLKSLPITRTVPDFIPPNVPTQELEIPQTQITELPNGIRVVSQEVYGQMCTVGVLTNVGSRHETQEGLVHLMETLAFSSTREYPEGVVINELLQDWGATRFVSHSREQTLHCIDVLRPNVEKAMHLLSQVVLEPLFTEYEIESSKEVLDFQAQEQIPELVLGEALQVAAYGTDQQLGRLHFATSEAVSQLSQSALQNFFQSDIKHNPEGMVVAGAGIGHDELVGMATHYFGHMDQKSAPVTTPSIYRGGQHTIAPNPKAPLSGVEDEYCRVALAFPVGGWHSDNMVTACVLQTLLGGGSSFSAGGPGKGMYSRMYQHVLNRYDWMETAEAFTSFAEEGGLFGVSASTPNPTKVNELVMILADQLAGLAINPVNQVELSRAQNMLKCNVLTQLESRLILFEDMGRQVLTYGKREDAATTCRKIEAVTAEDILQLARQMLQKAPTLAATGNHLDQVPSQQTVAQWFQ
jgi:processing peptidase subunit alpha